MLTANDDLGRLKALIEEIIASGDNRLPPEPRLSDMLGVSRGKLRTLLKRVEDEGLIWRHVGKGTFVGPRKLTSEAPASLALSMDDILTARLVLEPQLAAQAAMHSTAEDLQAMDACLSEMADATSLTPWKRLDDRLHRIIAQASHNMLLLLLYDTLRDQGRASLDARIEAVFGMDRGPQRDSDHHHRELVEAIRAHDPERAERWMHDHIRSVRTLLFGLR